MLAGLEHYRRILEPASFRWSGGASTFVRSTPGEGGFRFDRVTVGVVLAPLRTHHAAYGDDRRRSLPLMPGHGWVFPAGMDGWCRWDEPNDFLNVEIADDLLAEAGMTGADLTPQSGAMDPLTAQLAVNIHAAGGDTPQLYRDALAAALAAQIAHMSGKPEAATQTYEPRLRRALDYIEAHLDGDITLEDLASVAALSRFHFARAFRDAVGMPPHAYVVARRIERAKNLLGSSRLSIADVAWQVGYANPAKFAAQFRKLTGRTPAKWRTR